MANRSHTADDLDQSFEAVLQAGAVPSSLYAAPDRATDLTGLPPTFIMMGELDVSRDEVIDYANRLLKAGVPTELHVYPGCFHAFEVLIHQVEISKKLNQNILGH